jgi:hypothetical protein
MVVSQGAHPRVTPRRSHPNSNTTASGKSRERVMEVTGRKVERSRYITETISQIRHQFTDPYSYSHPSRRSERRPTMKRTHRAIESSDIRDKRESIGRSVRSGHHEPESQGP